MMNIYNGNVVTDNNGLATIEMPDWFEALNRDFRYQLTVVDTAANTVWGVINHNSNFGVWGESIGNVPDTEGTIDIAGFDFVGFETVNPGPNQVSFLEITYDGVSSIILNTFFNDANGFDTEIGLYSSSGLLIESNDNANSTLQSRLVLKDLPAGTYYLAAGLFNSTFGATDFQATSNSGIAGIFRVDALTFPENVIAGDVNRDGLVNLLDIAPFVNALVSDGYMPEADINCDSVVNLLDVSPFVTLLSGPYHHRWPRHPELGLHPCLFWKMKRGTFYDLLRLGRSIDRNVDANPGKDEKGEKALSKSVILDFEHWAGMSAGSGHTKRKRS